MRVTDKTPEILQACLTIHNESFRGAERAPEGVFRTEFQQGEVFTVEWYQRIVGFAIVTSRMGEPYLWAIAVAEHARGNDLGDGLMHEIDYWARFVAKKNYIELTVNASNPAQKLYFDHGYRVTRFIRDYYSKGEHGLVMRRVL